MKDTKTKIALWVLISLLSLNTFAADNATINNVNVIWAQSLEIDFDGDLMLSDWELTGDIKILKDIKIERAEKDFEASNMVNITLGDELRKNTSYNLLSIFWADGSIDFSTEESLENVEIINNDPANTSIEKIVINDSTDITVYYTLPLDSEEFEYKLFLEIEEQNIAKVWNAVELEFIDLLTSNSNYTIILLSLEDMMGKKINFDDGLFDFTTGEIEVVEQMEEVQQEVIDELNAAGEEGNVEELALWATETPDTGAETWVLILGTLIINTFLTSARRKKSKIA